MSSRTLIAGMILSLFLASCAQKQEVDLSQPHKKSFEEEDTLIIRALEAYDSGDMNTSYETYLELFKKSNKREYHYRAVGSLIRLKEFEKANREIDKELKNNPGEAEYLALKYLSAKLSGNEELTIQVAEEILNADKSRDNYERVANIYIEKKDYKSALPYLESAYAIDESHRLLEKIVNILYYYEQRREDAIAYLETHIRLHGCDEALCSKLANFYRDAKDVDNMIVVYKNLYDTHKRDVYAKSVVELYIYKDQYDDAIAYLKETGVDDSMLLEIYRSQKEYKKAMDLAVKLHEMTEDLDYLAQAAMYEYEFAPDKHDKKMLESVIAKLGKVVENLDNHVYQNFLGYMLIDHDMDVERGMELVRKALVHQPKSPFYLDSLAWGYYKLGDCKNAYNYMKQVIDLIGEEDEEVKSHWDAVRRCYQPVSEESEQKAP